MDSGFYIIRCLQCHSTKVQNKKKIRRGMSGKGKENMRRKGKKGGT